MLCTAAAMRQLAMANPGARVAQKLEDAGLMEKLGREWFFLTAGEAVKLCSARLRVSTI
jgi:hypothetical protein